MTETTLMEELASRESAGIQVTLLWSREGNALRVVVFDNRTGEEFSLTPEPEEVMDVYRHPFAYAARRAVASTFASDEEPVATR